MRALCGFRSAKQIASFVSEVLSPSPPYMRETISNFQVSELRTVIGFETASRFLKTTAQHEDSSIETKVALKVSFHILRFRSDSNPLMTALRNCLAHS